LASQEADALYPQDYNQYRVSGCTGNPELSLRLQKAQKKFRLPDGRAGDRSRLFKKMTEDAWVAEKAFGIFRTFSRLFFQSFEDSGQWSSPFSLQ
jgi:hypothetical protein